MEYFWSVLKTKKIVVFIDDLDRCETENILNLLSAIKLFFTLGDNIIFVCGLDKNAVQRALKVKYNNDEEKAEEYLNKIFSLSFSMPRNQDLQKFIHYHFGKEDCYKYIKRFLEYINFNNPRKLKKMLNKYYLLAKIKDNPDSEFHDLIPDIITSSSTKFNLNVFNTIFVLYIIILYQFYPNKYLVLKNYEDKLFNYRNRITRIKKEGQKTDFKTERELELDLSNYNLDFLLKDFEEGDPTEEIRKLSVFTPKLNRDIETRRSPTRTDEFLEIFPENILYYFTEFVYSEILSENNEVHLDNNYPFKNLFKMAEILL